MAPLPGAPSGALFRTVWVSRPVRVEGRLGLAAVLAAVLLVGCPAPFPDFAGETADACVDDCDDGPADRGPDGAADAELDGPPKPPPVDSGAGDGGSDEGVADAAPADAMAVMPEVCNGRDDDADVFVDEGGACGPFIETRCRMAVSWAAAPVSDESRFEGYAACVELDDFALEPMNCRHTAFDGQFRTLRPGLPTGPLDMLGLRFTCSDDAQPELAAWIEDRCTVFLGHATADPGPGLAFGPCPDDTGVADGQWCLASGTNGRFIEAEAPRFAAGDTLAVGFRCRDAEDPQRAAAVSEAAAVFVGWTDTCPAATTPTWGNCPAEAVDDRGSTRCTSTAGDAVFQTTQVTADFGPTGCMGFALRARSAAQMPPESP